MNVPSESALGGIRPGNESGELTCRFELDPRWSDTGDRYVPFLRDPRCL
jgi:hypothetical protein